MEYRHVFWDSVHYVSVLYFISCTVVTTVWWNAHLSWVRYYIVVFGKSSPGFMRRLIIWCLIYFAILWFRVRV
jgi:hypothetical protein